MAENAMNFPKRNLDENNKKHRDFFPAKKQPSPSGIFRQVKAFTAKGEGAAAVGTLDL